MLFSPFIPDVLLFSFALATQKQIANYHPLPPLREQAAIQDVWTAERISNIPNILKKYNVDAWLMTQKEYAEDTVFWSLKSATLFSARRRTVDLFLANGLSRNWIDNTNEVWNELLDVLEEQNVTRIAINADEGSVFSSGLHVGEFEKLKEKLGVWKGEFAVERMVGVEFVATMVEGRLGWYRKLQETAWAMITEGFSESVVVPGETTTEDVEWWLREKILQMNYTTWFQPSVSVLGEKSPFEQASASTVIEFGDLLHVDFGVTALGINTDTQHLAYVLKPGETENDIPAGYLDGLKKVNRLQDILRSNMVVGVSGNEILNKSLAQMRSEGMEGRIYSHPIGDWGHAAGTSIGMFNLQDGVPILGDLPLLKHMYFSIELYAEHFVPQRNLTIPFFLEEDVYWDKETEAFEWVVGRQDKFHLIDTEKKGARVAEL